MVAACLAKDSVAIDGGHNNVDNQVTALGEEVKDDNIPRSGGICGPSMSRARYSHIFQDR